MTIHEYGGREFTRKGSLVTIHEYGGREFTRKGSLDATTIAIEKKICKYSKAPVILFSKHLRDSGQYYR